MFGRGTAPWLLLLAVIQGASEGADGPVEVALLGVVQPRHQIVTVADVARLSGGNLITRRRIAALDVVELGSARTTRSVSKQQVRLRILLSGISPDEFKLTGAESVLFKSGQVSSSQTTVLEFLRPGIAQRLNVDPADVQIRLMRPLAIDSGDLFKPGVRLEHFLPPTIRPGTVNARIGIYEGERLVRTLAVLVEVLVARDVYVAKRSLEAGTTITANDVGLERKVLPGPISNYPVSSVIGRKTRTSLRSGTVLTGQNLQRSSPTRKEIVVRSRDIVEVVARRRGLQVRISGAVALQQGAIGEAIRVKNPNSGRNGRVLTARIVDAGVVEIQL